MPWPSWPAPWAAPCPRCPGTRASTSCARRPRASRPLPPRRSRHVINGQRNIVGAIIEALNDLDHSYLAVQGPPGTGKTFVASHVIAALVKQGWKIGVVAQSHAVVDNVLTKAITSAGVHPEQVAKKQKAGDKTEVPWSGTTDDAVEEAAGLRRGRADRRHRLDHDRQAGPRGLAGPAGHRRGRAVFAGQHPGGLPRRHPPAPAGRPAAAAAGHPGLAPATGGRVGAGLAQRRAPHAARRNWATSWPIRGACTRSCAPRSRR